MQLDYTDVQATALRSLTALDADLGEQRSSKALEREAHRFAAGFVDVFTEHLKTTLPPRERQ